MSLRIRVLGPASVSRDGVAVPLPRSRKVRALLAYLALQSSSLSRSRLCDLLWDVPNDPRGELRWCLSKLRGVLDDADRRRVVTVSQDLVTLDLSDCVVDALEVDRSVKAGLEQASREQLGELCQLFGGDLLEGMQIDGNPEFSAWLMAQRQRYRAAHVSVLQELSARAPRGSDEAFVHLHAWLALAPFDQRAHETLLAALLKAGRVQDADDHVAGAIRSFEQEGLDWSPLRQAWQSARRAPLELAASPAIHAPAAAASLSEPMPRDALRPRRRASIAVMPLSDGASSQRAGRKRLADGLTEDIITRLAKLRTLFVIARGTVYALGERGVGAEEAGRILNVDYVASGRLRTREGRASAVVVELTEAPGARIVWTDEFDAGDTFSMLDAIVDRIVAALAEEIESAECKRAILKPPSSLDAWEAYHCGLWHMYKFNRSDNLHAGEFFHVALQLDPTFSRAHAGLSFTHFQNAFLDLTPDRERQMALALETAGRSLSVDDRDPAAHWAMGRALWLNGEERESLLELQCSIDLSPNFALGHYTLGFVHSQTGDPRAAIDATNYSRELSPFDPLQFAMLASRALAHVRLGELAEAADWAVKATGRPNAHAHILAIAAECLSLANRRDEARKFVARIRERVAGYCVEDFLRAFRFERDTAKMFRRCARQIGFDSASTR